MDISLLKTVCFTCLCAAYSLCCATSKISGAYRPRDHGAKSKVAAAVQSAAVNNNTARYMQKFPHLHTDTDTEFYYTLAAISRIAE